MKKLVKWFKGLPREVKMMIALVGLGSPIGAIYFLRRFFPHTPLILIVVYVALAVGAICLLVFLISLIFSRGRRKRTQRLAADLASEGGGGPQSMDIAAAIKANNEKFFAKIREMRKDVGINVYELPWYIVIGDSGCGKTKLINEGGLTFSTGKPEGYQLGTLNYNWWFAEEAIFIDMAGRLCNPQDDNDRREWVSMLETIAKGRRGFPINGVVVCVSADHLLQDPPEKIERDANTALERLRDLQARLGVTFATYVVVTKCDKILGFMQFFDRAERDITVKNQMFGWSKPGEFNELHDPEAFQEEFGSVYNRLHELRVRRLNDDADEVDLGLAYSFPEEFRSMYDPLQIYVRTLFPMIRNPRAMKNLIFRGIYFTSATQEGGLILKHVAERLGQQAADQFAPLDELYPNKRPHFIKDVLVQKMVPEHGLVFRNEEQVLRNRRLNKLLKVGTVVVAVVLTAGLVWGSLAMSRVTTAPREHAQSAARLFDAGDGELRDPQPSAALKVASSIERDAATLRDQTLVRWVVSTGIGASEPIELLDRIRARLANVVVVRILHRVEDGLRDGEMLALPGKKADQKAYLDALKEYASWYGCRGASSPTPRVSLGGFQTMLKIVKESVLYSDAGGKQQVEWYFDYIHRSDGDWPNPAAVLADRDAGFAPVETLQAALGRVYEYFNRLAHPDATHPNAVLRGWLSVRDRCERADKSYGELLDVADEAERIESLDELGEFQQRFTTLFDTFDASLTGCTTWGTPSSGTFLRNIPKLSKAIGEQRREWVDVQQTLRDALNGCAAPDDRLVSAVDDLRSDRAAPPRLGLDHVFWNNLQAIDILDRGIAYRDGAFDDAAFADQVREINQTYERFMVLTRGDGVNKSDTLTPTEDAAKARSFLQKDRDRLAAANFAVRDDLSGETLSGWADELDAHLTRYDKMLDAREGSPSGDREPAAGVSTFVRPAFWHPEVLARLDDTTSWQVRLGEGTQLLRTITRRLDDIDVEAPGSWGVAEMVAGYQESGGRSPYDYPVPERRTSRSARHRAERSEAAAPTPRARRPRHRPRRSRRDEEKTQDRRRPAPAAGAVPIRGATGRIPRCASHGFLNDVAENVSYILDGVKEMATGRAYLPDRSATEPAADRCRSAIERTTRAYMRRYLSGWATAYDAKKLERLDELRGRVSDWQSLAGQLDPKLGFLTNQVGDEFDQALWWILEAVPWSTYDSDPDYGGYWDVLARESDGYGLLGSWMRQSIETSWQARWNKQSLIRFMNDAPRRGGDGSKEAPWKTMSGRLREEWVALAKGIVANATLDNRVFGRGELTFGKLAELQVEFGLIDERLTGELVDFSQFAEDMLSAEITRRMVALQTRRLGKGKPDDGWPYLPGKRYDPDGLDTVDFGEFKSFLTEVVKLRADYEPLERGLRRDALGLTDRKRFYKLCAAWYDFLGLGDGQAGTVKPVTATIERPLAREGDPPRGMELPEDGCQNHAEWCLLDIGLRVEKKGTDSVKTACETVDVPRGDQSATWGWENRDNRRELVVQLIEPRKGVRPIAPRILGRYSELALCAYLHRYGRRLDERSFVVLHNFEVEYTPEGGVLTKKTVGQRLRLTLDRAMPKAIGRLTAVSASARAGR